ncbi:translation initiation factor IF-2-like isoform X2 [Grus americana]|uniref:translation initiation factor IF-2-like isoform X2 n=1 Tax=Grus americana TaxID=9117 RepID=UPI002407C943|nr:translation initiation factor IF-2-like isoform X2 [Grus americana]
MLGPPPQPAGGQDASPSGGDRRGSPGGTSPYVGPGRSPPAPPHLRWGPEAIAPLALAHDGAPHPHPTPVPVPLPGAAQRSSRKPWRHEEPAWVTRGTVVLWGRGQPGDRDPSGTGPPLGDAAPQSRGLRWHGDVGARGPHPPPWRLQQARGDDAGRYLCRVTLEIPHHSTVTGNGTLLGVGTAPDGGHPGLVWGLVGALGGTALLLGLALLGRRCCRRNSDTDIYLNVLHPSARAPRKLVPPPVLMENSTYQEGPPWAPRPPPTPRP